MTKGIDFTKQYEFKVEVFDDELGEFGSGTLRFGLDKWSHISFDSFAIIEAIPEGRTHRSLKAKTIDGVCFTLFNCERRGFSVGASYVCTKWSMYSTNRFCERCLTNARQSNKTGTWLDKY